MLGSLVSELYLLPKFGASGLARALPRVAFHAVSETDAKEWLGSASDL